MNLGFVDLRCGGRARSAEHARMIGMDPYSGTLIEVQLGSEFTVTGPSGASVHVPLEGTLLWGADPGDPVGDMRAAQNLAVLSMKGIVAAGSSLRPREAADPADPIEGSIRRLLGDAKEGAGELIGRAYLLIQRVLPGVQEESYAEAVRALADTGAATGAASGVDRRQPMARVYRQLRSGASGPGFFFARARDWASAMVRMAVRSDRSRARLLAEGKVIALVGPDASGKTTLATGLVEWLEPKVAAQLVHTGKPQAGWLTWIPGLALRFFKRSLGRDAGADPPTAGVLRPISVPPGGMPLFVFALRSLWIAHDRRRAVKRAFRMAGKGYVVVCDRYPSSGVVRIDGPRLQGEQVESGWLIPLLTRMELRLYKGLPRPSLKIRLSVSVEVALRRNRLRAKRGKAGDAFVRARHSQWMMNSFNRDTTVTISAEGSLHDVTAAVRRHVWEHLA